MDFLHEAIDVASQIPHSFFTQMESKKWSDRKEALESIEKLLSVPRIQNSDFNELVRVLKKTIAKDSNIVVVTLAAKCLCLLAQGLRSGFSPYANSSLTTIFEKFKEKKPTVISVLRDASDAAFIGTNIESIYEDIILLLDNKNPQIKTEMCLFLARTFARYPDQVLNKKTLRPLINALIKTLSDMDATVRDNSAMAIGTAMKVSGEKLMMTLIADVEPIKVTKIKECCEKAEIIIAESAAQSEIITNGDQNPRSDDQTVAQQNGVQDDAEDDEERIYDMLEAVDVASQIAASFYTQMESKKWSDRKEALEVIEKVTATPKIQNNDFNELVRVLKKTIAKDSNIVVVTLAVKCLGQLAQGLRANFAPHSNSSLTTIFEKFKEKKPNVIAVLRDASDAAFVGTNLENILEDVTLLLDSKNPQIKSEISLFLARTFAKYPAQVLNKKTLRPLINALIKTLSDMDATVRDNSAMAIGTAMKVTGEKLMMTLIADVEPIKLPKIKEFCEKAQVKKIPKSVLNALQNPTPAPAAAITNHTNNPPSGPRSSATMVRSTSNRRLTTSAVGGARNTTASRASVAPAPVASTASNATVKRNATIIKRSTVPSRRSIAPPSTGTTAHNSLAQGTMGPPAAPVALSTTNHTNNTNHHQSLATNNSTSNHTTPSPPSAGGMVTPAKPVISTATSTNMATNNLYRHGILDTVILKLISDNYQEVSDAINELEEVLSDDTEQDYKKRINQMIDLICLQLISTFDCIRTASSNGSTDEQSLERLQKITNLAKKLFARKQLIVAANQQKVRFLLFHLFLMAQSCENLNDEGISRKSISNITSTVMDGFEPANIMCILTGLLNEPMPMSIVEPVKDAIIRSMRSFK